MAHQGLLLVLSGPSGVGKGTVKSAMVKQKAFSFEYSVSMTTRKPRPGEVDGKDYYFVSEDRFQEAIRDNELLEYKLLFSFLIFQPISSYQNFLTKLLNQDAPTPSNPEMSDLSTVA